MRARPSIVAVGFALAFLGVVAPRARADDAPAAASGDDPAKPTSNVTATPVDWSLRRKHTIAELELGFIALPNAPISPSQQGGSLPFGTTIGHGDATASLGLHFLYRGGADWAIGAGALFCPNPTSETTLVNGITRTHSRDYLWMGAEARYIPIHFKTVEAWVGLAVGGVLVADRFTTDTTIQRPPIDVPSDLGTSQVTVKSEGFALGLQVGGEWEPAENLVVGLALRFDNWILPSAPSLNSPVCTPIGDCPTLSGPVTEIEFGIRLGYRIPL
jgi:hypothetical protein